MVEVTSEMRLTEFGLGNESFAVNVVDITDIITIPTITPIPQTDSAILGLFNLRGVITAIIDIAPEFNLTRVRRTPASRVMVLEPKEELSFAVWVDYIADITSIQEEEIMPVPKGISGGNLLAGVFNRGKQAISIINPISFASMDKYASYR